MRYVIGSNVPGYLPEDDEPYEVEDETLARRALADLIERDWDAEDEVAPVDCIASVEISNRYLDAHTGVNTLTIPGSVHVPGPTSTHLGRTYWVAVAE
jgi:hypothetical protein